MSSSKACTVADLAARISDTRRRQEFVQFLVLVPYLDMEVDKEQVAVVDEIAGALGIDTDTLTDLHRVRDDRLKRLLFDYSRRSFREYAGIEGAGGAVKAVAKAVGKVAVKVVKGVEEELIL